ncbi:cadherin domain-containing protein [Magnetococcus sp. PR-3]|uniref:cadherin domain-containing protein n=1 Tax=Magnetococcus sp. PR-3 TaxID=3120355 RepID=UPI002FCE4A51
MADPIKPDNQPIILAQAATPVEQIPPQATPPVTLIIDGVRVDVSEQMDVTGAENLEISGDTVLSGEQSGNGLILQLASGAQLVLQNFFGTPKALNLPIQSGSNYKLSSANEQLFDEQGFADFTALPTNATLPGLDAPDTGPAQRELQNRTDQGQEQGETEGRDPILDSSPEFFAETQVRTPSVAENSAGARQGRIETQSRLDQVDTGQRQDSFQSQPDNLGDIDGEQQPRESASRPRSDDDFDPTYGIINPEPEQLRIISSAQISQSEDVAQGDVLYQVQLSGVNPQNAAQQFSIVGGAGPFQIDQQGQLTLKPGHTLDYETATSHEVTLQVSNAGQTAARVIQLNVVDVNDNAPVITSASTIQSDETSHTSTVLYTVTTSDVDSSNGTMSYALENNPDGLFSIDSAGQIQVAAGKKLDFEEGYSNFSFNVTAHDGVNRSLPQNVTLTLNDLNDETPVIATKQTEVVDNIDDTTLITTVSVSDRDAAATNGATVYTITDDVDNLFEINSSGEITLQSGQTLDYDTKTFHTFTLASSDGVNSSAKQQVIVSVVDYDLLNNTAPVIDGAASSVTIDENSSGVVTTVQYSDVDATNGAFTHTLVKDANGLFTMNTSTGQVSLAAGKTLDYEADQSHTIQVKLHDGANTSSVENVVIALNDLNDEAPVIRSVATAFAAESITADGTIHTVAYTDADKANGSFSFSMDSDPSGLFEIDSAGQISLQSGLSLDFESATSHTLTVKVNDGSNDSQTQTMTVNVQDVNDTAPVIRSASGVSVAENISDRAVIHTLRHTDADAVNGTTLYTMTEDQSGLFEIDSHGQITLKLGQTLDYEQAASHTIKVQVNDGSNSSAVQTLSLNVTDVNDNVPVMTSAAAFSTLESVGDTDVLHTLSFSDADSSNGSTLYTLTEDSANLFEINQAGEITLQTGKHLDRESQTRYDLKVKVNDGVNDALEQSIQVTVTDANDNALQIISQASATVAESVSDTTTLLDVNVLDPDTSGTLSFSITSDASNLFEIDSAGLLTLKSGSTLDYETATSHEIVVVASDGVFQTAGQQITLTVSDVNDTAPVIVTLDQILDEQPDSTSLFTLTVTDEDTSNGTTFYELTDTANDLFDVTSNGTVFYLGDAPDAGTYAIKVQASDGVNVSAEKTLNITVTEPDVVNDNAPVINAAASAGSAVETVDDTTTITTVQWSDRDPSTTPVFALTDDSGGLFEIDAATGVISLVAGQSLDYESATNHTVVATVADGVNTSTAATITLTVTDANDNAPILTSAAAVTMAENATSQTVLHSVTFSDADGQNGVTSYTLSASPFQINSSGQITLKPGQTLDYESIKTYSATVSVSDGLNNSASQLITFTVSDVNDVVPVLAATSASLTTAENTADSSVLYTLSGSDGDATAGTLSYTLSDDGGGLFEVNSQSGEISLVSGKSLDYETATGHPIKATVSDGVNTSSEQTLTVTVTDVNDVVPVISSANGASVAEGVGDTSILHSVTFTDADTIHGNITYTMTEDLSGLFEIDSQGQISLRTGQGLDYESAASHTVKVKVADGLHTSEIQTLSFEVTDVNDVTPVITSVAALSAAESVGEADVLHTVTYNDTDSNNGTVTYAILNDASNLFEVDTAGQVTLQSGKSLDYESITSHLFTLQVTDGAGNATSQNVTLNVTNVDDEAPLFQSQERIQVLENLSSESLVLSVAATDNTSTVLTYAIVTDASSLFAIDGSSGALILGADKSLDYDTATQHQVVVSATDAASNTTTQSLTIDVAQVDEINNMAPIILGGEAAAFSLYEDATSTDGAFGAVRLQDIDIHSGSFTFSLTDSAGGLFEIDASTGELSVVAGQSLDYETTDAYTLTAQVSDGVNTSDAANLTITINNVDEAAPTIGVEKISAQATWNAGTQTGSFTEASGYATSALFRVTALDTEFGDQSGTTWSSVDIVSNPGNLFEMRGDALYLKSGQSFDYETTPSYTIGFQSTDAAGHTSALYNLTLNIDDINDNRPDVTDVVASVAESAAASTVIHTVAFTDADSVAANGATSYQFAWADGSKAAYDENRQFRIDASTGEITPYEVGKLDYATQASHTLSVAVGDGEGFGYGTITVNVQQPVSNDHAPVVTAATAELFQGINTHSVIHQIAFTDADDAGLTRSYSYSITTNPNDAFEVDDQGQITLKAGSDIDFSAWATPQTLQVSVSDGSLSGSANVTLNLHDAAQVASLYLEEEPVGAAVETQKIAGDGSSDSLGESVDILGDINGDGYDDYIVGARLGDTGGSDAGNAYVVFGQASGFGDIAENDLNGGDGSKGFLLIGRHSNDTLGKDVTGLGDINGDGYDDILVGARLAEDDSSNGKEGEAYVIYGQSGSFGSSIDFQTASDYNGSGAHGVTGFEISGSSNYDYLGRAVAGVGDMNGDGYDDMLITAPGGNGFENGVTDGGEAYIIYGKSDPFSDFFVDDIVDGTLDGFVIWGRDGSDELGDSVSVAGDVNGDGFADLIIGASLANGQATDDGEAYLLFGSATGVDINLDTTTLDGSNGFEINGENAGDDLGISVSGGGDINGDGYDDIIVGAPDNDAGGSDAGSAYLLYGKASGFTNLDLNTALDGSNGSRIVGESAGDSLGDVVAMVGDVNGDGYDDIMVNNHGDNEALLIFGKSAGFGASLNVSSLNFDGSDGVKIIGDLRHANYNITAFAGQGDINSDGFDDLILGVADGYGSNNDAYTILGRDFSGASSTLVLKSSVSGAVETGESGVVDHFMGTSSTDTYRAISSGDTVRAAAGDDQITIAETDFFRIDGGHGTDTLTTSRSLDFTAMADSRIENVEIIDLGASGAEITLDLSEILNLSTTTNTLRVDGSSGRVSIFEDGFSQGADEVIGGSTYHVYNNGAAKLQIQDGLFPNINANTPTISAAAFAVTEGDSLDITTAMLNAADGDTLITTSADLTFSATVSGGSFQLSGQHAASFTLKDVADNKVDFVHDGSETTPAFSVTVSDGVKESAATTGSIPYTPVNDHTPTISRAEISYKPAQEQVITESMLAVSDADTHTQDSDLIFTVSNLSNGEIRLNSVAASTFNLADLKAGNVMFYDAEARESSFNLTVTDGTFTSTTASGTIVGARDIKFTLADIDGNNASQANTKFFYAGSVGDLNGDGIDDFYVEADVLSSSQSGATWGGVPLFSYERVTSIVFGNTALKGNAVLGVDLTALDGSNGFRLTTDQSDAQVGEIHLLGDVNGDGIDDIAIDRDVNEVGDYLHGVDIIFGKTAGWAAVEDQRTVSDIFIKNGVTGLGYLNASSIARVTASDYNRDGYDDLTISFNGGDEGWIVWGKSSFSNFTLKSSTSSSTVEHFNASFVGEKSREEFIASGDFNGDGYDDLILRADSVDYMVYGNESNAIDNTVNSLTAADGLTFDAGLALGSGDFNGDGYDDVLTVEGSSVYLYYGSANLPATWSVGGAIDASQGFVVAGEKYLTYKSQFIGDFNGDGYDDLHFSYPRYALEDGTRYAGRSYLVFGGENIGSSFSLDAIDGSNGIIIEGRPADQLPEGWLRESVGTNISSLGDVNGDGFDDIALGTYYSTHIIWGGVYGGNIKLTSNGTGSSAAENFVGSAQNDTFTSVATGDTVRATGGNDTIGITSNDFRKIDGGSGIDTLLFSDSNINLDLTDVALLNAVEGVEAIDMGDGNGTSALTLGLDDVLDLPSHRDVSDDTTGGTSTDDATTDLLRILGDGSDTVNLPDFADSGTDVVVDGVSFDLYSHSSISNGDVLIEQGINVA